MKIYKKQQRKYIKDIIKYIKKNEHPYDFYPAMHLLMMMLKRRLEYFETGDVVYQADEYRLHAAETLKKAIELGEYALNDGNFVFQDIKDYLKLSVEEREQHPFPLHDSTEWHELEEKIKRAYKDWFCYIVDNMCDWWD